MLIYVNITDGHTYQKYSSEPHKKLIKKKSQKGLPFNRHLIIHHFSFS